MKLYTLKSEIYLDKLIEEYRKIVIINKMPEGILRNYVIRLRNNKLSIFDVNNVERPNCIYGIKNPLTNELLEVDDITDLFSFLLENNYEIDNSISKILLKNKNTNNNFICVIKEN
jgi:hypothetical protein